MSATGLESLEHTVQLTHEWINELDRCLGWNNRARSCHLLRAELQALRDRLIIEEAADLAAQLPTLLRGVYYEQWQPTAVPERHKTRDDFVARVAGTFKPPHTLEQPVQAVMAVFDLLSKKVSAGEIDDVRHALPQDLRNIWPEKYRAPGAVQ
jgi:uncharacterized protein (DUF2267 family)